MAATGSCEKRLQTCEKELNSVLEQLHHCQSKIVEYDPERIRMLEGMKQQRDDTILQNAALVEEKRILEKTIKTESVPPYNRLTERKRIAKAMEIQRDEMILQNAALVQEKRLIEERYMELIKHRTQQPSVTLHTPVTQQTDLDEENPFGAWGDLTSKSLLDVPYTPDSNKDENWWKEDYPFGYGKKRKRYSHRYNIRRKRTTKK
jgi:hypothetical protein